MHIVITGANRGIGLALTKQYLAEGHKVTAVCRGSSAALTATQANIIENIDVSNPGSANALATQLEQQTVDILINNAGILHTESLQDIHTEQIMRQFEVNSLGPLIITHALLSHFAKGAKIALITSRMGSIADNGSGSFYGYRMSKAALNAAGVSLAQDLKPKGISVAILHPGFVATDMVGNHGDVSAEDSASNLIQRISQLSLDNTGTFWHANGEVLPW